MDSSKHSKLPWQIVEWAKCDSDGAVECTGTQIADADDHLVSGSTVEGCSEQEEADVAFIVRAVNSHDQLVAALKDALHCFLLDHYDDHPTANNWRAALAAASA